MSYLVSLQCVPKLSKVLLFLVLFTSFLCGTAFSGDSSANSNIRLNSSQSANQSGSNVVNSSFQKSVVSQSLSSQTNSSLELPKQLTNSDSDPSKSDCKTEPCPSAGVKQNDSKSLKNTTNQESTNPEEGSVGPNDPSADKKLNPEALMRGFYVFVGLSAIVMAYIAWKSFGKRPAQVHRYGVIANREDLEMAPLDSDEGDDDDTTHFDLSKHRLT